VKADPRSCSNGKWARTVEGSGLVKLGSMARKCAQALRRPTIRRDREILVHEWEGQ
jgi:hypothetical protein